MHLWVGSLGAIEFLYLNIHHTVTWLRSNLASENKWIYSVNKLCNLTMQQDASENPKQGTSKLESILSIWTREKHKTKLKFQPHCLVPHWLLKLQVSSSLLGEPKPKEQFCRTQGKGTGQASLPACRGADNILSRINATHDDLLEDHTWIATAISEWVPYLRKVGTDGDKNAKVCQDC